MLNFATSAKGDVGEFNRRRRAFIRIHRRHRTAAVGRALHAAVVRLARRVCRPGRASTPRPALARVDVVIAARPSLAASSSAPSRRRRVSRARLARA